MDLVIDGAAVHEEQASCDPEGKCKRGPQTGEHVVGADVGAEGADVFDGGVAALRGGEGGGENGGARGGVGCGGVQADYGAGGDWLVVVLGEGNRKDIRVVSHMQHDPDAIHDFVAAVGVEETGHVAVFVGETEFPRVEFAVELAVLLLPLLHIGESGDVDGLFQEPVDLGEDSEDFNVVAE